MTDIEVQTRLTALQLAIALTKDVPEIQYPDQVIRWAKSFETYLRGQEEPQEIGI